MARRCRFLVATARWRRRGRWSPITTSAGVGYEVVDANSGSCLDIASTSTADAAQTNEWQCLGATRTSQVWQVYPFGTSFELVSLKSGRCLDLTNGSSSNNTVLQQWDCGGGQNTNQLWTLHENSSEGAPETMNGGPYMMHPAASASLCVDVSGGNKANGTAIQAFSCNNTAAQSWSLAPVSTALGNGYHVVDGNSGSCLDVSAVSTADGAKMDEWQCLGATRLSQVFQFVSFGSSFELVSMNSGKCLDLTNGSTANNTILQQWDCSEGANYHQLWNLSPITRTASLISASATAVSASPTVAVTGQTVVVTSKVSAASGVPAGTVTFSVNGREYSSVVLNSGTASVSIRGLANGTQSITAQYAGGPGFAGSSSSVEVSVAESTIGVQAFGADAFVDSIGVQTHLSYVNTNYYSAWPKVLAELKSSGIRHVRDGFVSTQPFLNEHQQLAAAGIGATIGVPLDFSMTTSSLESFAQNARDLEALEAPNECDNGNNCGSNGTAGLLNAVAFMPTLMAAGRALQIPVVGPSFVNPLSYAVPGNISSLMNYNNLHVYFGGRNPGSQGWGGGDAQDHLYGSLPFWVDMAHEDAPQDGIEITETGYISYPTTNQPWTIPESVEASYEPRLLLLNYSEGIQRTFLYELVDEPLEPGYGLLRSDLSERPAFVSIKSLVGLLSDPGATFTPGKLNYTLAGGDGTIREILMQKRDGSFWLAIWSEQSSYDPSTNTPTPVSTKNVTLALNGPAYAEQIYKFGVTGTLTSSTLSPTQTVTLPINDCVSVVQITPP